MKPAGRLPGIRFITQPSLPDESLPRMDIAAFVGFARSGPLHTPVPVESMQQFRDIFGESVVLQWNPVQGVTARGYLYATVAEFFANGGVRCWVVRVADNAGLHAFAIKNLVEISVAQDTILPVTAQARSPGSWAQQWRVRAAVRGSALLARSLAQDDATNAWYLSAGPVPSGTIRVGELIGFNLEDATPGYFFVDRVVEQSDVLALQVGRLFIADAVSPPQAYRLTDPAELISSPSQPFVNVRRLRLDLIAEAGNGVFARVDDLAFSSRHLRFWGRLPNDHTLFKQAQGELDAQLSGEQSELWHQAQTPRFPLAGLDAYQNFTSTAEISELLYLPFFGNDDSVAGNAGEYVSDGLENLQASLFLNGEDSALSGFLPDALRQELEERFYIRQLPLKGIYSLLPVLEASFVSIPDLIHLSPNPPLNPSDADIPQAPRLIATATQGEFCLDWEAEDTEFELQSSASPTFNEVELLYQGERKRFCQPAASACKLPRYYRVRIRQDAAIGLWSNPVVQTPLFANDGCALLERSAWYLSSFPPSPPEPGAHVLQWQADNATDADSFILQASDREDFASIISQHEFAAAQTSQHSVMLAPASVRFFRVRGIRGGRVSLWSNSVRLVAATQETITDEQPVSDEPNAEILAVQRALINFCAARQDMLAILTLPAYSREQALRHVSALPGAHDSVSAGNGFAPARLGDLRAQDYAAVFHPWLAVSSAAFIDEKLEPALPFMPCDGAICGSMAATTLRFGSWIAPANRPLANAVALSPALNEDDWAQLAATQVNVLRADGRGFALMGADTLSITEENRPLNVRRLLIMLRKLALREGSRYVFEPDSIDFRNRVHHYFSRVMANLYSRGAFAGSTQEAAYRVVTDGSVNTRQSIDMGRFIVELRVAPSRPLEFLTIRLAQSSEGAVVREGGGNG